MKQVQFKALQEFVNYEEIVDNSHVGVLWGGGGKTMVVKGYDEQFRGLSNESSSLASAWGAESKQEYAKKANNQTKVKVFTFESHKELLTWFAE
jgi:hypothetical protein